VVFFRRAATAVAIFGGLQDLGGAAARRAAVPRARERRGRPRRRRRAAGGLWVSPSSGRYLTRVISSCVCLRLRPGPAGPRRMHKPPVASRAEASAAARRGMLRTPVDQLRPLPPAGAATCWPDALGRRAAGHRCRDRRLLLTGPAVTHRRSSMPWTPASVIGAATSRRAPAGGGAGALRAWRVGGESTSATARARRRPRRDDEVAPFPPRPCGARYRPLSVALIERRQALERPAAAGAFRAADGRG